MGTFSITLNEEHLRFLEEAVKSGRFSSESEVVAKSLSDFLLCESARQRHTEQLMTQLQIGLDQADRGEFVEFTAEEVLQARHERLASQSSRQ